MFETENGKFVDRHIGLSRGAQKEILNYLGHKKLEDFIASVVPEEILDHHPQNKSLPQETNEIHALQELREISQKNHTQ